jgi:hypothetical protein
VYNSAVKDVEEARIWRAREPAGLTGAGRERRRTVDSS